MRRRWASALRSGRGGVERSAKAAGILFAVDGVKGGEHDAEGVVPEIGARQIPAGVADGEPVEMTIGVGHLEADGADADGAVGVALLAVDFETEGAAQLIGRGCVTHHAGPIEQALDGRLPVSL